jgi:hypothetical protein
MKQRLLSRLILAGLAGAALSAAHAGQIQSSSVSIAREVVTTNAQTILAPSASYRFNGDVDARAQAQTFQVQFQLVPPLAGGKTGTWATLPANPERAIKVTNGITNVTANQSAAIAAGNATYQVTTVSLSADATILYATITVAQDPIDGLIQQPIVSINATTNLIANATVNTTANRASLKNLFDVTGDIVADFNADGTCSTNKTQAIAVKHFNALTAPASLATVANATEDEHNRSGAANTATLVVFPTNVKVTMTQSGNAAYLTPGGNMTFSNNGAGGSSWVGANTVMLGDLKLTQNSTGYDSNLTNQYLLNAGPGLSAVATAVANNGVVETKQVDIKVTASNGFVVGGSLAVSTTANCGSIVAGSVTTWTAANAAGPITVTVPTADVNATFGATGTNNAYVCYTVPGGATIPSSSFSAVGTVVKAAAGANLNEQNNVCKGPFYSLGGGLKIDVRNYASSAETSGYMSVLRFVNNSDSAEADVWAQFVHQNGKLGNWAKIADLPVRGSVNMTASQIDAKLAAGSAATQAIGTAAPVAQAATTTTSDTAPRLRITSTTGRSLRVQNYLFNRATNQILEASASQGVDFEGALSRAPASEGQYQDQDANSGLNLAP